MLILQELSFQYVIIICQVYAHYMMQSHYTAATGCQPVTASADCWMPEVVANVYYSLL